MDISILNEAYTAAQKRLSTLPGEIKKLEEDGCINASAHWRGGKYLTLLYPVGSDKKKEYVGARQDLQERALRQIRNNIKKRGLEQAQRDIAAVIVALEKGITLLAGAVNHTVAGTPMSVSQAGLLKFIEGISHE
ncbi:hypothetical protein M2404_003854 [Rheinheimera pacifica]|uniref:hypothetical protein n=1 Tax=Rheinheimera pacifica TaxID=173990 RepID=UPI002169E040|nr:hypothetical protein [Rheinheimera pacifica]MCS4309482.1 hypothetical protein [Rheinheimera pacifica]